MPSTTLSAILSNPESRRALVKDAESMLDEEVSSRGGLTGMGIKAAFSMVKTVRPGIIGHTLDDLMPEFASALDPVLAQRPQKGGQGVAAIVERAA